MRTFMVDAEVRGIDFFYTPCIKVSVNSGFIEDAIVKAVNKISNDMCVAKRLITVKDINEIEG